LAVVKKSILVPYSAQAMFQLVDDIAHYPEFVHWCVASKELHRCPKTVQAALTFEFHGIRYTFTTHNTLTPFSCMAIALVDGPFEQLSGQWSFTARAVDWCEVTLDLEYRFAVPGLSLMFEPIFSSMAHHWVDAFCQRAQAIYDTD
jgi:ribosome-associated toxin RatA of RatAB toxin-antitoxin module